MRRLLRKAYLHVERSEYKAVYIICAATFFISVRVAFEVAHGNISAPDRTTFLFIVLDSSIWLSLWYSSCFVMWLVWFRYMAQAPLGQALYVLLATVLLWIPILHVGATGGGISARFLSYDDPGLLQSIFTLMYLSPANDYTFSEFAIMAVSIFAVAYLFSRSVARSILTALGIYFSLIFIQAFIYVCSAPLCVFLVPSALFGPVFIALYFVILLCAWLCLLLLPELLEYAKTPSSIFTRTHAVIAAIFLTICTAINLLISNQVFDILFMLSAETIFFYVYLFLTTHARDKRFIGFNVFLALYGLLIFAALVCAVLF